jgi:hypothetical protein
MNNPIWIEARFGREVRDDGRSFAWEPAAIGSQQRDDVDDLPCSLSLPATIGHGEFIPELAEPTVGLGGAVWRFWRNELNWLFPIKSTKSARRTGTCDFGGTNPLVASPAVWRNKPTCA